MVAALIQFFDVIFMKREIPSSTKKLEVTNINLKKGIVFFVYF
jgi:hypothetical protein